MTPDELATWGLKLVRRQANWLANRKVGIQADELIGEGTMALAKALSLDDGKRNIKAYITLRVKGAMIDYKRRCGPVTRTGLLKKTFSMSQLKRDWWAKQSREYRVQRMKKLTERRLRRAA